MSVKVTRSQCMLEECANENNYASFDTHCYSEPQLTDGWTAMSRTARSRCDKKDRILK